jgi:hypothetical protein
MYFYWRNRMNSAKISSVLLISFILSACAGNMTFIPRSGGQALKANYQDGMGQTAINVVLPSGETLQGSLIWIPPGGGISTALATTGQGSAITSGMTSGNKGMYVGSVVGDRGINMRIELLCNAWTGRCVGAGQTSDGIIYDIQR